MSHGDHSETQLAQNAVAADINWNQHIVPLKTLVYWTDCCILPHINQACVARYNRQSSTEFKQYDFFSTEFTSAATASWAGCGDACTISTFLPEHFFMAFFFPFWIILFNLGLLGARTGSWTWTWAWQLCFSPNLLFRKFNHDIGNFARKCT